MFDEKPLVPIDAHDLLAVFTAAQKGDYSSLKNFGNKIVKILLDNKHDRFARELKTILREIRMPLTATGYSDAVPKDQVSRIPLLETLEWPTDPSFLNESASQLVGQFIEDVNNVKRLMAEGVSTQARLILHGPPGTGKTHLAKHLAAKLNRHVYVARLDSLISSRLGETSKNIREVFDFIPQKNGVLLLDELDAIAKLRDDRHELGELKRVVNTVLQGLDSLSVQTIVIGATNHPHILDSAIWRRFPYKVELEKPDIEIRNQMWIHFLRNQAFDRDNLKLLSSVSSGLSGAEIELIAKAVIRRTILDRIMPSIGTIVLAIEQVKNGGSPQVDSAELTTNKRKKILKILFDLEIESTTMVSKALDVSRQMAHRYKKEYKHVSC